MMRGGGCANPSIYVFEQKPFNHWVKQQQNGEQRETGNNNHHNDGWFPGDTNFCCLAGSQCVKYSKKVQKLG